MDSQLLLLLYFSGCELQQLGQGEAEWQWLSRNHNNKRPQIVDSQPSLETLFSQSTTCGCTTFQPS